MLSLAIPVPNVTRLANVQRSAWLGIAAIAVIDAIWAQLLDFHVIVKLGDFEMLALLGAIFLGLRLFGLKRASMIGEFLALSVALSLVFTVLCYLALASSGNLVDAQLLAVDRALGFDWLADFKWVMSHPVLADVFHWLYGSLNWQVLYLCVLLGLMEREKNLQEMFWLIFVAALLTNALAIAMPAYGPFEIFGLQSRGFFLADMKHLKSGHDLTFALSQMTGVISFPSFHTVMALSYAWCMRRTGIIGYTIAALNLVMLFGIPFFGGHYLIDVIGGACVMLVSVGIVKTGMARAAALCGSVSTSLA